MQRRSHQTQARGDTDGYVTGVGAGSAVKRCNKTDSLESRQREEITGLQSQLDEARKIIDCLAKSGPSAVSKKRIRRGSASREGHGVDGLSLDAEDELDGMSRSPHPAETRVEKLRLELEESKILREKERKKFELLLGEADSQKEKLLRQVKFLAQEEEDARKEHEGSQDALVFEAQRLREELGMERAELEEAKRKLIQLQTERQSLARRVERESASRHVAEEKLSTTDEQLKARVAEVAKSRREIRELQGEKARLSRDVAALRRDSGVDEPGTPLGDQDTPATRALRSQLRASQREARRWESMAQELKMDQTNTAALYDEVDSLKDQVQRSEAALKAALEEQARHSAIAEEKEEWSMLFTRVLQEERRLARVKLRGEKGRREPGRGDGELEGERRSPGGEAEGTEAKVTPLGALRLLREIQEEKSVMVKELVSLRLRQKESTQKLADAEKRLQEEAVRAEGLRGRAEDMDAELEKMRRRCRSAEHEAAAQKELIESYERDSFRKPASEEWLSDHASMEAALAASKQEVESLRRETKGQVSATEASRLRKRAEEAQASLAAALKEKDDAVRELEKAERELALHEKRAATGADAGQFKVLHMVHNPVKAARQREEMMRKEELEALRQENKRLLQQLESVGQGGAADSSMSMSVLMDGTPGAKGGPAPDEKKFSQRLQQIFKKRTDFYREAVYLLTGYKIDLDKDPSRKVLTLRSMYAEDEADCLKFQYANDDLDLLETPFAVEHTEKVSIFLSKCHSIPAFLSTLTLELFEKQTHIGGTLRF